MIMDKTVDKFIDDKYVGCSGFHDDISLDDVVKIYKEKSEFSKVFIRQWKNGKVVRSITI